MMRKFMCIISALAFLLMNMPYVNSSAYEKVTELTLKATDATSVSAEVEIQNITSLTNGQFMTFSVDSVEEGVYKFLLVANTDAKEGVKVTLSVNGVNYNRDLLAYYSGNVTHSLCRASLREGQNTITITVNSGVVKLSQLELKCIDNKLYDSYDTQEFSVYDYLNVGNEMYYVDAQKAQGQPYIIIYEAGIDFNFIPEANGRYDIAVSGKSGHSSSTVSVSADDIQAGSGSLNTDYDTVKLGNVFLVGGEVNKITLNVTNQTLAYIKKIYITKTEDTDVYREYYVSSEGDDENSGNNQNPFKTIKKAKEKIAEINDKMTGDIVINIMPGIYKLDETEIFDESHSGKNGHRVIFKAQDPDNPPEIIGGRKIEGFIKENGIFSAPLDNIEYVRNLYIDTYPAIRARSSFNYEYAADYHIEGSEYARDGIVVGNNDFPMQFENPQDMEVVCLDVFRSYRIPVEDVIRKDDKTILILNRYTLNSLPRFTVGSKFYLENAIEFLDEPGEFYWDSDDKIIYYYSYENEDINKKDVYIGETELLFKLKGKSNSRKIQNITFDNLVIRYGAWNFIDKYGLCGFQSDSKGLNGDSGLAPDGTHVSTAQFQIDNAEGIEITNCEFSCLGSIAVSMVDSVLNSKFEGNVVRDTSATGIMIGTPAHAEQRAGVEVCMNIDVKNNTFLRVAGEVFNNCAISTYYENNIKIQNNTIKDVPYTAITVGWGWEGAQGYNSRTNDVSYNKIINPMAILEDGGGIYTLGKLLNTKIYNNYIEGSRIGYENVGVYLDAGSNYIDVYSNVIKNMKYYLLVQDLQYLTGNINAWDLYSNRTVWAPSGDSPTINVEEATIIGEYYEEWQKEAQDIYDAAGSAKEYNDLFPKGKAIRTTKLVEKTYVTESENVTDFLYPYKSTDASENLRFNISSAKMPEGASITFEYNAKEKGNYKFLLHSDTYGGAASGMLTVNGADIRSTNLIEKENGGFTTLGRCALSEGKNVVTFTVKSGTVDFKYIEIQSVDMPVPVTDREVVVRAYDYLKASNEFWYVDTQRKDAYYFLGEKNNEFCPVYVDRDKAEYSLNCETGGNYEVFIYASNSGSKTVNVTGYKNGASSSFGRGGLAPTGSYRSAEKIYVGDVLLEEGKNTIQLKTDGSIRLFKIFLKRKLENSITLVDETGIKTESLSDARGVKLSLDKAFNGRTLDIYYALYKKDAEGNITLERILYEEKRIDGDDVYKEFDKISKAADSEYMLKVFIWSGLIPKIEALSADK